MSLKQFGSFHSDLNVRIKLPILATFHRDCKAYQTPEENKDKNHIYVAILGMDDELTIHDKDEGRAYAVFYEGRCKLLTHFGNIGEDGKCYPYSRLVFFVLYFSLVLYFVFF